MNDEKKAFLKRAKIAQKLICSYQNELIEHRLLMYNVPTANYNGVMVTGGEIHSKIEDMVVKLTEYESKVLDAIENYIHIKDIISQAIDCIENDLFKLVLRLYYVNGKTHAEVADLIGYSIEQEKRICEKALECLEIPKS